MSLIYFHHHYARKGAHFREIIRRNTDLPKVLSSFLKKTILIASGWPKDLGPSTGEEVPHIFCILPLPKNSNAPLEFFP